MPFDSVTELQSQLDALAELFFNCIGIIQRDAAKEDDKDQFQKQVTEFSQQLVKFSRNADKLISSLPGVSFTKSEQLNKISQINQENQVVAVDLKEKVKEAGKFMMKIFFS